MLEREQWPEVGGKKVVMLKPQQLFWGFSFLHAHILQGPLGKENFQIPLNRYSSAHKEILPGLVPPKHPSSMGSHRNATSPGPLIHL